MGGLFLINDCLRKQIFQIIRCVRTGASFTSRTRNKRKRGRRAALNEESVGRGVAGQVGSCRGRYSKKFLQCDKSMTFVLLGVEQRLLLLLFEWIFVAQRWLKILGWRWRQGTHTAGEQTSCLSMVQHRSFRRFRSDANQLRHSLIDINPIPTSKLVQYRVRGRDAPS